MKRAFAGTGMKSTVYLSFKRVARASFSMQIAGVACAALALFFFSRGPTPHPDSIDTNHAGREMKSSSKIKPRHSLMIGM
jgi:hypothetical protein